MDFRFDSIRFPPKESGRYLLLENLIWGHYCDWNHRKCGVRTVFEVQFNYAIVAETWKFADEDLSRRQADVAKVFAYPGNSLNAFLELKNKTRH